MGSPSWHLEVPSEETSVSLSNTPGLSEVKHQDDRVDMKQTYKRCREMGLGYVNVLLHHTGDAYVSPVREPKCFIMTIYRARNCIDSFHWSLLPLVIVGYVCHRCIVSR